MKTLFQLPATAPVTPQTDQGFALSRSRYLPTQRISRHMIQPANCAEILANLPAPGHCLHTVVRGDFILADLITQIVRQSASDSQKAAVATNSLPYFEEEAKKRQGHNQHTSSTEKIPESSKSESRDQAAKVLSIGTLSMNPENARELRKLIDEGLVGGITMVISDYFFRTSRDAVEECFQILPPPATTWLKTRSHVKIALIPTATDAFVLHGSANLRSSANLENLTVENDRALLAFHESWIAEVRDKNTL